MINKITSKDNDIVKLAAKLCTSKKDREDSGLFIIEGLKLCLDAVNSDIVIKYLLVTQSAMEKLPKDIEKLTKRSETVYIISEEICDKISDTKSPQGVFCICFMLDKKENLYRINNKAYYLALENIRDPGNLGTLIRAAESFGIGAVLLNKGCTDIYNPKVIRGTMGSLFRIPILLFEDSCDIISALRQNEILSYAAVVNDNAKSLLNIIFKPGSAVFIGNEANGLEPDTINMCDESFTIVMKGRAESLNAAIAGSVVMWEMTKSI